jgi:hypothetical protein
LIIHVGDTEPVEREVCSTQSRAERGGKGVHGEIILVGN